jgi:hypothetical protein
LNESTATPPLIAKTVQPSAEKQERFLGEATPQNDKIISSPRNPTSPQPSTPQTSAVAEKVV